jgi:hypothetical protein
MHFVLDVYDAHYRIGASTSWDWRHTCLASFYRDASQRIINGHVHMVEQYRKPRRPCPPLYIIPLPQVADWILLGESLSKWRQK